MTKTYLASLLCIFASASFTGRIVTLVPDNNWKRALIYALLAALFLALSNTFSYADGKQESKP